MKKLILSLNLAVFLKEIKISLKGLIMKEVGTQLHKPENTFNSQKYFVEIRIIKRRTTQINLLGSKVLLVLIYAI